MIYSPTRAISSVVERFIDIEEAGSSILPSRTMADTTLRDTVVIYHGNCRDGFGGALAAWKKFGDEASYIPARTQEAAPEGLVDKTVYLVDYSYSKQQLDALVAQNSSVIVIDHHKTAEEAVTAFPENVFDLSHSGAVLAWKYFHPDTEVPLLLQYIEDHDLWKFKLPDTRPFGAALGEYEMTFPSWDDLMERLEDATFFAEFVSHGQIIAAYQDKLVESIMEFREKILFQGYEGYAINASRIHRSILGNKLAELNKQEGREPFGIVYYRYEGHVHCSLRSRDDFDVRLLAEKYGGGGHTQAASIRVKSFNDLPFTFFSSP